MIVSIVGIPGSGKSTQIESLTSCGKLKETVIISIPALFGRRSYDLSGYLTKGEKETIAVHRKEADLSVADGRLAPLKLDEIAVELAVRLHREGKTVLMDGCPRGRRQAAVFADRIESAGVEGYAVVELAFFKDEYQKSQERQFFRTLGEMSSVGGCIERMVKIPKKINVFLDDTRPGLEYLARRGVKVHRLDAEGDAVRITEQVIGILEGQCIFYCPPVSREEAAARGVSV